MEIVAKKKQFNKRAFISTTMFISGLFLPFTGFMNHTYQLELTQARHFWMSVHNVSGVLFIIFLILHLVYNWKTLLNYIRKAKERFLRKEALTAILLVIIIVGLISSHTLHH